MYLTLHWRRVWTKSGKFIKSLFLHIFWRRNWIILKLTILTIRQKVYFIWLSSVLRRIWSYNVSWSFRYSYDHNCGWSGIYNDFDLSSRNSFVSSQVVTIPGSSHNRLFSHQQGQKWIFGFCARNQPPI